MAASPAQRSSDSGFSRSPCGLALSEARAARPSWASWQIEDRLRIFRWLREQIALDPDRLARATAELRGRPVPESLGAEVLPLIEALRFLESSAASVLAVRRLGRYGRPWWLGGTTAEVIREPHGVVLIFAPSNYPLFLPAVQMLQALVAGNAVLIKPAPGCSAPLLLLASMLAEAGLPRGLLAILPETLEGVARLLAPRDAFGAPVDFVVLTGRVGTGRVVLRKCADALIPAIVELSGSDVMFVCADADISLAADALTFGLRLNMGATCIAPRRVFVHRSVLDRFEKEMLARLASIPRVEMESDIGAAIAGARLLEGDLPADGRVTVPLVVADSDSDAPVFAEDHFIPWCAIVPFDREEDAIRATATSPYGLGASVFSADETRARKIAGQLRAGIVCVNDIVAPTADPRLPFGGRAHSGHGVTRGAEGLLALTVPKVITRTHGKVRRHFQPPGEEEAALFRAGSALHHSGTISGKLRGLRAFLAALLALARKHRP